MKNFSELIRYIAVAILFLLLSCPLFAQPNAGDQWIERANAYADDFWRIKMETEPATGRHIIRINIIDK